ncbi:MAG TPA: hypothetical protein VMZ06_01605 [Candidatus Bathyarchaeia archaeon]|nr:hypothetical protein [Candidatus Bathyarchaeia archaeon]
MNHPERIILIALMAGIVSAGFTWFGWELFQNIFAILRRRPRPNPPSPAEQKTQRNANEKTSQKPATKREVNQKGA